MTQRARLVGLGAFLVTVLAVAAFASLAACSGDDDEASPPEFEGEIEIDVEDADHCDFLDTKRCLFPFPNDYFTVEGDTTTGRRVDFEPEAMPVYAGGVPIDLTEWNRNDGFSPGSPVMTFVPGIDLEETGAARITDMGASLDEAAPIVLLDLDTGERHPYWAELDATVDPATERPLLVHPARNLLEGHTYVVALRNPKDEAGRLIEASPVFRAYRDRLETDEPAVEERRAHMENLFAQLDAAGVGRDDLYLVWDFTVASSETPVGPRP